MTNPTSSPEQAFHRQGNLFAELSIDLDRMLAAMPGHDAADRLPVTPATAEEVREALTAARDAADLMAGAHARVLRGMRTG